MGVLGDAAEAGVDAGIKRAERYGLRIEGQDETAYVEGEARYPAELQLPLTFTRGLVGREEASARFSELFAEMVTVASIARHHYNDAALTEAELHDYLQHSYSIFNSFRHA